MDKKRTIDKSLLIAFGMILLILLLPVIIVLSQKQQISNQQAAGGTTAQITVNPATAGSTIALSFDGFSIESFAVCDIINTDKQNPALAQIFKNLGSAVLRVGGDSVENTSWSPGGSYSCSWDSTTITQSMINDIFAFAKKVNWKIIWGVNLKNGDSAQDADQAAYVTSTGGPLLEGIEIGNEPNLYGWSYSQYQSAWEAVYTAIKAKGQNIPIIGPAGTACCSDLYTPFISAESSKLVAATDHYYPTANSTTVTTLLSSTLMQDTVSTLKPRLQLAKSKNLPYILGETNAISNLPPPQIGKAFAMALWGLDYMFTAADMGVDAMNFHGSHDGTSPFGASNGQVDERSLYYSMLMFHYAASNGKVIPAQITTSANVTTHSVLNSDGKLQVIIINKDQNQSITAQINTTQSFSKASAIRLTAPSATATSGVTLGGAAIARDGTWSPTTIESVQPNTATSSIDVPAVSAVVITYEN